jgi:integrase
VKQAYGLAIERGHLSRMPSIRHLSEKGNERKGFFSEKEFRDVLAHLPADLKDFALFAFLTGWRRGEIASLTWSDVEDKDAMIRLRAEPSKNGVARAVPLVGELADLIKRRRQAQRVEENGVTEMSRFVFHRGGRAVLEFRKSWASACAKAGVNRLFHDLRRSAVRRMVQAGIPQQIAKKISGHKTDSMFQRYAIVVEADLREALEKTAQYSEAANQKVVTIGQ